MFGVSFTEIIMILVVALLVAGPRRLPGLLATMGRWVARLRQMTTDVRRQTGIDEILRAEGLSGGISELRSLVRGEASPTLRRGPPIPASARLAPDAMVDAHGEALELDRYREFPVEGPDAYGAIPEDLVPAPAAPPTPTPLVPGDGKEPA